MTTLRRAAELNTGNYDFLGLSPVIKAMVEAAKAAHELTIWLDMTREEIASLGEGDDEHDDEPIMNHARDMYDAWELWQRLEQRVAPILARTLDEVKAGDVYVYCEECGWQGKTADQTPLGLCPRCGLPDLKAFVEERILEG